jgi:hypothetical protein
MKFLLDFTLFALISLSIGLGSSWYMLGDTNSVSSRRIGSWIVWPNAASANADPYTRAHVNKSGWLPAPPEVAIYYMADKDSYGNTLKAHCSYQIEGKPLAAKWWSMGAFSSPDKAPMKNIAEQLSFNSSNVLRKADGTFSIYLSTGIYHANWLPITGDSDITLLLRIYGAKSMDADNRGQLLEENLPIINKIRCDS